MLPYLMLVPPLAQPNTPLIPLVAVEVSTYREKTVVLNRGAKHPDRRTALTRFIGMEESCDSTEPSLPGNVEKVITRTLSRISRLTKSIR